jgi:hypothetical protein
MGMAPFGVPRYVDRVLKLISVADDETGACARSRPGIGLCYRALLSQPPAFGRCTAVPIGELGRGSSRGSC